VKPAPDETPAGRRRASGRGDAGRARRRLIARVAWLAAGACGGAAALAAGPTVPKAWDARELAAFELPLVRPDRSAQHAAPDYYYRLAVRPIYRSYAIYAPGREPAGYRDWLERQEPSLAFDAATPRSEADWAAAGEAVFDAPIGYNATFKLEAVRDPAWYERNRIPLTKDGVMPFSRYVIRKQGVVEVGSGSCLMCHARVMPDGTLVKGAQGNFPADRIVADNLRHQAAAAKDPAALLESVRLGQRIFFSMPWLTPDPAARADTLSLEAIARAYDAVPVGASTRVNLSLFAPAQIPDLIGVGERRFLDHTGLVQQRSIADLMRYVAIVQGANAFDRFGEFRLVDPLPDPARMDRYSDEQLYALGRYLYSLKPPANPHRAGALSERGRAVFSREGCNACHTAPLYTSNRLTPASEFVVPSEHLKRYAIINRSVGTDPELAMRTRKGTGYYKIPSLKGVWYRGPFQHAGAVPTLTDWLDPARPQRVPGHPFGLTLTAEDRRALIAFLETL
jgi:hypothetical protein